MPDASKPAAAPSAAVRWTPPILWLAIILVGTSWPSIKIASPDLALDKVAHFSVYAILAALALRSNLAPRQIGSMVAVVLGVSVLGAVDEWHQSFIPGRSMSFLDWCADTAGALSGVFAARFLPFFLPRRQKPQ